MQVIRHEDIEKDLRRLQKFAAPRESLEAWERFFCVKGLNETTGIDRFSGFGNFKIYKGRVVALKENVGKAKGYRVVFQFLEEESYKIIAFSRHGIYHSEQDLINLVRSRL